MSSEHFHVHGAHEHEVEHKAHAGDSCAARVAVMTAVLATIGALMSYQGGATQNDALLFKSEAAIRKTEEFERASVEANTRSEASMHVHHRWVQATTLVSSRLRSPRSRS